MIRLSSFTGSFLKSSWSTIRTEGIKGLFKTSLYRNAIYLMLNSVLNGLLGMGFWITVARFYQPADVGMAAAIISAMVLLADFSNLGLHIGIVRFLPGAGESSVKMINSCFTLSALAAVVASGIFVAGLPFWSPALLPVRSHPVFLISFLVFSLILTVSSLLGQVFIARRSAKFTLIQGMITSIVKIPLVVLMATFFGAFGIFGSVGVAIAISTTVGILWFLPKAQKGYKPAPVIIKTAISGMAHYSLGNYFAGLLRSSPITILPIMVVNMLGAEVNAFFYVAWSISTMLFMVPAAISLSLFAEGSHRQNLLRANVLKSLKLCLLILLPVLLLIFAIGDKLLLLFGETYSRNATSLLWILVLSILPFSIVEVFLSIKRVEKDMKGIMAISAATAVCALGLSYFLMQRMGAVGAGLGWTGGQTVVAVVIVLMLYAGRKSKYRINSITQSGDEAARLDSATTYK